MSELAFEGGEVLGEGDVRGEEGVKRGLGGGDGGVGCCWVVKECCL